MVQHRLILADNAVYTTQPRSPDMTWSTGRRFNAKYNSENPSWTWFSPVKEVLADIVSHSVCRVAGEGQGHIGDLAVTVAHSGNLIYRIPNEYITETMEVSS